MGQTVQSKERVVITRGGEEMGEGLRARFAREAKSAAERKGTAQDVLVRATNDYMAEHNLDGNEFPVAFRRVMELLPANAAAFINSVHATAVAEEG